MILSSRDQATEDFYHNGDPNGFFSIRVNDQWRLIFRWGNNAYIPMGISKVALAKHLSIPVQRVNEIVRGKSGVTPDTA